MIIVVILIFTSISQAQSSREDVTISAQYAVAHHDKRVFHSKERLLRERPENWGTWEYGIVVSAGWVNGLPTGDAKSAPIEQSYTKSTIKGCKPPGKRELLLSGRMTRQASTNCKELSLTQSVTRCAAPAVR